MGTLNLNHRRHCGLSDFRHGLRAKKYHFFYPILFFFVILQPQNRGKGMKNLYNILNINKLSKNSGGG